MSLFFYDIINIGDYFMRKFDYIHDYVNISTTILGYITELEKEIYELYKETQKKEYLDALKAVKEFNDKYPKLSSIQEQIQDDLLSPKNFEYCMKNGVYPDSASKIGEEFTNDLNKLVNIEKELTSIAVSEWNSLTKFEDIKNGEDFMIVGHSSSIPLALQFKRSGRFAKLFLSCSLFSNNELNSFFNNKIINVVDVNNNNYISSSSFDSVTNDSSSDSFNVLKCIIDEQGNSHYINVGFSNDTEKSVTGILTPKLIEKDSVEREISCSGEKYKYDCLTNEIVLDKTQVEVKGLLLLGDDTDFLLGDYLKVKETGLDFKCINRSLYREKNNQKRYDESNIEKLNSQIDFYVDKVDPKVLSMFYKEVVIPMCYPKEIKDLIVNKLKIKVPNQL